MGSMARDGGNLIIGKEDYAEVAADPVASKYLRPFLMGRELIQGIPRWCLWLEHLDPADLQRSPILRDRVSRVRDFRLKSRAKSTQQMAATPHLFGQRAQPSQPYVGIPSVFSEHRRWATVARLDPAVIAGNKIYTAIDPDGFIFAVMSSSMFITWQKTVGGRLESRPNFSNTVVWNNLPLPDVSQVLREQIIEAGQSVIQTRALHPARSLADHYNPLGMDANLIRAHNDLDRVVDRAFGARTSLENDRERQDLLFKQYAELTAKSQGEGE